MWVQVLDMLVYKGREELLNFMTHSKQRHHIISQWVVGTTGHRPSLPGPVPHHIPGVLPTHNESEFLKKFYLSN